MKPPVKSDNEKENKHKKARKSETIQRETPKTEHQKPGIQTSEKQEKKKHAHIVPTPPEPHQLEIFETHLKAALTMENPDVPKAIAILDQIDQYPVTVTLLQKCSSLVTTVKKIRRYKASTKLMEKAEKVYNRFKIMFCNIDNDAALLSQAKKNSEPPKPEPAEDSKHSETKQETTEETTATPEAVKEEKKEDIPPPSAGLEKTNESSEAVAAV